MLAHVCIRHQVLFTDREDGYSFIGYFVHDQDGFRPSELHLPKLHLRPALLESGLAEFGPFLLQIEEELPSWLVNRAVKENAQELPLAQEHSDTTTSSPTMQRRTGSSSDV